MKVKLENTISTYRIRLWNHAALRRKWNWAQRISIMDRTRWSRRISHFDPTTYRQSDEETEIKRPRGRPRLQWHYDLNNFARYYGFDHWIDFANEYSSSWHQMADDFIKFVLYEQIKK